MARDVAQKTEMLEVKPRAAMAAYIAGLVCLGAFCGTLTGLSSSPVVAVLLPLLFALVAGTSGFYVVRMDAANPSHLVRVRQLGISLVAFALPCWIAATYGILIRTGAPLSSLLPHASIAREFATLPSHASSGKSLVELTLLRKQLAMLGASREEQGRVLQAYALGSELAPDAGRDPNPASTLQLLRDALQMALSISKRSGENRGEGHGDPISLVAFQMERACLGIEAMLQADGYKITDTNRELYVSLLVSAQDALTDLLRERENLKRLIEAQAPIEKLYVIAYRLRGILGDASWYYDGANEHDLREHLLYTLHIMAGSTKALEVPLGISYRPTFAE